MKKEELEKIKLVKDQIKRSIKTQKWSFNDSKWGDQKIYTYLNSINEEVDMKDATIRIIVKPNFAYSVEDSSDRKVTIGFRSITIAHGSPYYGNWQDFNALNYGFSKLELRFLRWRLFYGSIKKEDLRDEFLKERAISNLAKESDIFIKQNKELLRDSKLDELLNK